MTVEKATELHRRAHVRVARELAATGACSSEARRGLLCAMLAVVAALLLVSASTLKSPSGRRTGFPA